MSSINPSISATAAKDERSSGVDDDRGWGSKQHHDEDSDIHNSDNSEKQKRRRKLKRARQGKKPHGAVNNATQTAEASSDEDQGQFFSPGNNGTDTIHSSGGEDLSHQTHSTIKTENIGESSEEARRKCQDSPSGSGKKTSERGRDIERDRDSERRHDSPPTYEGITEAASIHTEPFSFEEVLLPQPEAERALGTRQIQPDDSGSVAVMPPDITITDTDSVKIPYTELETLEEDQVHDFESNDPVVDDESETSQTSQQWRQCPLWAPASRILREIQVEERSVNSESSEGGERVEPHSSPNEPGNNHNFQAGHGKAAERPILEIPDSPTRRAIEPCTRYTAEKEALKIMEDFDLMNAESSRESLDQPNQQGSGGSEQAERPQTSFEPSDQHVVAGSNTQAAGPSVKSSQSGKQREAPQIPKVPALCALEGLPHYDRRVLEHSDPALRQASYIVNSPLPREDLEEMGYPKFPLLWKPRLRFMCTAHVGYSALENLGVGPYVHWRTRRLEGPLLTPEWLETHPRGTRTWSMGLRPDGHTIGMHTGVLDLSRPIQSGTDRRIIRDEMRLVPQDIPIASDCINKDCSCGLDGDPGHYGHEDPGHDGPNPDGQEDRHRSQSPGREGLLLSGIVEGCLNRIMSFLRQCFQPSSHVQDRPVPLRNLHRVGTPGRTKSRGTAANTNASVTARDQSSLESSEEGTLTRAPTQVSRICVGFFTLCITSLRLEFAVTFLTKALVFLWLTLEFI